MFGLDLIYKIEHKLQVLIKGRQTSVLLRIGSPKVLYLDLNFELNNVFQWLTSNKLTLNLNNQIKFCYLPPVSETSSLCSEDSYP